MIKTIFLSKDTTIYESTASMNTGIDEILEIKKIVSGSGGDLMRSRVLVQFDTSEISASLSAKGITTSADSGSLTYALKMFVSKEEDVQASYNMQGRILLEDWDMGIGKSTYFPTVKTDCTWTNRKTDTAWGAPGGVPLGTNAVSQSFNNVTADINFDVTTIVEDLWHDNPSYNNYGLLIQRSGSEETDINEYGKVCYYSRETNTIYPPRVEVRYDDTTHEFTTTTGSEATINDDITIEPRIRTQYIRGSEERIILDVSKKYSARSQTLGVGKYSRTYLPQSSSYAIIDNATGEKIINHNATYTYVGRRGNTENYFDIDTNALFPERYYSVEVKVNYYDGVNVIGTKYFNSNKLFKIVK